MATKFFKYGSFGPYDYNDTVYEAFETDGQGIIGETPTLPHHVVRLEDVSAVVGFPSGAVTGDIVRWNSVTAKWEAKSEPLSFTQINLTPSAAAILDIEGGMYYKSGDKAVYVCTQAA